MMSQMTRWLCKRSHSFRALPRPVRMILYIREAYGSWKVIVIVVPRTGCDVRSEINGEVTIGELGQ